MAATPITLWRNYDESDATCTGAYEYRAGEPLPTIEDIGWEVPSGKNFKEWNTSRDGSGTAFQPGDLGDESFENLRAIWEEIPVITYLTTDGELASVASAIRTKGGTSSPLVYPAGFINAINAIPTGTDTSDANATAADILSGKTAYVNGAKITGNITSKSAQTYTPTTTNQTIASGQYLAGTQTIAGDANLVPANIAQGVSIFGVQGTHSGGGGGIKYAKYETMNGEIFLFSEGDYLSEDELHYSCVFSGLCLEPSTSHVFSIAGANIDFPDSLIFSDIEAQDSVPIPILDYSNGTITVD